MLEGRLLHSCSDFSAWQKNQQLSNLLKQYGEAIPDQELTRNIWSSLDTLPNKNQFLNFDEELRRFALAVRKEGRGPLIKVKRSLIRAQSVIHPDDISPYIYDLGSLRDQQEGYVRFSEKRNYSWMYKTAESLRWCNPELLGEQIGELNADLLLSIIGWQGSNLYEPNNIRFMRESIVFAIDF